MDLALTHPSGWLKRRVVVPLILVSAIACSCRAQETLLEPVPPVVVTHRSVPLPPKADEATLWVALADYLGHGTRTNHSAPLLTLRSAGNEPLLLRDGSRTEVAEGRTIRLSWRLASLAAPIEVARKIAGPFCQF